MIPLCILLVKNNDIYLSIFYILEHLKPAYCLYSFKCASTDYFSFFGFNFNLIFGACIYHKTCFF